MNPIRLWMKRKPLIALLLVLLLSVGSAFCSVGVSAALASRQQTEAAAKNYTTVAIPYDPDWPHRTPVKSTDYGFEYHDLNALLAEAPVDARVSPVVPLQGIIPGSIPVKASDFDTDLKGYDMSEWPYDACLLAVRCDGVMDRSYDRKVYTVAPDGTESPIFSQKAKEYSYAFTVEEALSLPQTSAKELPVSTKLDEVWTEICREDGSPIFEVGKTYLIWGRLHIWSEFAASFIRAGEDIPNLFYFFCKSRELLENNVISAEQKEIWAVKDGDVPMFVEYSGSVEDFLQSEAGKPWRELIDVAERNHHSVKVLATDSVEALAPFCTRQDQLLEGRFYTPEEANSGAKLCLVSAAWAEKNGAKVGDRLPLSIYAPNYDVIQVPGHDVFVAYLECHPSYPEDDTGSGGDYEIIGIYTCPPPDYGSLRFDPDTVLLPKSSVDNAEQYFTDVMTHYPLLNPCLLPNGTQDELEAWLTERGLGGRFLYFDYGYSIAEDAIAQMADNGARLLIAGLAGFVLSLVLFALLLRLLTSSTVRTMRLLGQSPALVRRCFTGTLPLWVIPAVGLGGVIGQFGFGWVRERLLSASVVFDWKLAGIAALGEAIVLCAVFWLTAQGASKTPLVRSGKPSRKRSAQAADRIDRRHNALTEPTAQISKQSTKQAPVGKGAIHIGDGKRRGSKPVSRKGILTIAWKNLRHRLVLALGLLLLSAVLFSAGSLLRYLQRAQEESIERMTAQTPISCVVTNASGTKTEGINVFSAPFADMLLGRRRERGCTVDDYVADLRLSARERLDAPEDAELIRANVPEVLAPELKLTFEEGWDGSALAGTQLVCCVSEDLLPFVNHDGEITLRRSLDKPPVTLRIVGRVSGREGLVVCPFDAQLIAGNSEAFLLDRCQFTISDARRLDEAKAAFSEYFVSPGLWNADDPLTAGLLIQDTEYAAAAEELEAHVSLLGRLRTLLLILSGCLGLLIGFLMNRRRLRELAVMRCLGMKRCEVLLATALEQLLPLIPGAGIGLSLSLAILPDGSGLADGAMQLLLYLASCLACAAILTQAMPIRLMKTED